MATPKWRPGHLYPPGSIVVPRTEPSAGTVEPIENAGFETGDLTGWQILDGNWYVSNAEQGAFEGQYELVTRTEPEDEIVSTTRVEVSTGDSVTASCMMKPTRGSDRGTVRIYWYGSDGNPLPGRPFDENAHNTSGHIQGTGGWRRSSITRQVPAGARYMAVGCWARKYTGSYFGVDQFQWTYTVSQPQQGLQYRAVQPAAGYSADVEPAWPGVLGEQVVDNEVIWEAISISRVVYEARPILVSGDTEPDWPTEVGGSVADNTIRWQAIDPVTRDENCPHSKIVAIAKFKVYAGDGDIVRYTATLSPQDWTTEKDAGYLGTGVQQNGANAVAVLNLYRANLIVMNATTFQQWQIDPDPAMMDLLDTMDGIGSIHHLAAQPVGNELFYLSNRGVRTVGISGATNNLRAGDIGMPVDPIIARLMAEAEAKGEPPLGMYLPSMGQYWLAFNREVPADGPDGPAIGSARDLCPTLQPGQQYAEVMVYTLAQVGEVGAWSRYVFPYPIDDWTQEGNDLYVRDGDTVYRISEEIGACDFIAAGGDGGSGQTPSPFDALIQWPWLDMGQPGSDKQIESFDIVGYGECEVEFGYDQSEPGWFTSPYLLPADSVPGTTIPMPLNAPSYSVRLRYHGWNPEDPGSQSQQHWGFNALGINFTR